MPRGRPRPQAAKSTELLWDQAKNYVPFPKQLLLHKCPATEILFGGSAGPGKSICMRNDSYQWAMSIPNLQIYLFRRTFPELERTHILSSRTELNDNVARYNSQQKRWEFHNGSMLNFCSCQYEKDVFEYQSAEIHILYFDEVTTFTSFMYEFLRARVRCTVEIPTAYKSWIPRIVSGTNPGGVSHVYFKNNFVDMCRPKVKTDDVMSLADLTMKWMPSTEGGMLRTYIPATLKDNPILKERDPGYEARLDALPEPYRTAYKNGDWNLFIGQAFDFSWENHVIKPIPVSPNAPIYMTYDWGFGAPFSIGWWWIDNDNRLYRFAEWYGWSGEINKGIRMADSDVAKGIKERESSMNLTNRYITRLAGHDCFNKKPDTKGGGQGLSTADEFIKQGLYLTSVDPSRHLKIRQFRERLKLPPPPIDPNQPTELPMLVVYDTCEQFIRTVPMLQMDKVNVEDIDTNSEDHVFDESCQICLYRPMSQPSDSIPTAATAKIIDAIEKQGGGYEAETERVLVEAYANMDYYNQEDVYDTVDY